MPDASQSEIGILPCPGGMEFAKSIYAHLETITSEKMEERTRALARVYGLPRADIIRQINLASDISSSSGEVDEPVDQHRTRNALVPAKYTRFPNGEFKTEILSSVRNTDIYIVQDVANRYPLQLQKTDAPVIHSVNDHIFALLMTVDAALQAGALQVTVILPTFPYSRQHKKKGRESLSAARLGQVLEYFGVARIITLDIHSKEIENCFNHLRLENLHGAYQILKMLGTVADLKDEDLMVVAPDTGAVERSKFYASTLGRPLGMLYKERDYSRVAQSAERGNITDMKLWDQCAARPCSSATTCWERAARSSRQCAFSRRRGPGRPSAR
jgi:ribose-phosphate pyrophosphokinase